MKELITLATEKGFKSVIQFSAYIGDNQIIKFERLKYYLWLCELQKWLRDVHNIHIVIWHNTSTNKHRVDFITLVDETIIDNMGEFNSYEVALHTSLLKVLEHGF